MGKRRTLIWLGTQLSNTVISTFLTILFGALGLVIPLINQDVVRFFASFDTAWKIIAGLFGVTLFGVIALLLIPYWGHRLIELGKKEPHNVEIKALPWPVSVHEKDKSISFLALEVTNREPSTLSGLYAKMKEPRLYGSGYEPETLAMMNEPRRLTWKGADKENCEIQLGARNGQERLFVYKIEIQSLNLPVPLRKYPVRSNYFSFCDQKQAVSTLYPNPALYEIEINFWGTFNNGEELSISPFYGYIYVHIKESDGQYTSELKIGQGKPDKDLIIQYLTEELNRKKAVERKAIEWRLIEYVATNPHDTHASSYLGIRIENEIDCSKLRAQLTKVIHLNTGQELDINKLNPTGEKLDWDQKTERCILRLVKEYGNEAQFVFKNARSSSPLANGTYQVSIRFSGEQIYPTELTSKVVVKSQQHRRGQEHKMGIHWQDESIDV